MSDEVRQGGERSDLNPALKTRTDTTHDTTESSRSPVETASVQREEGRAWPVVWLLATLVGVVLVIWMVFI